MACDEPDSGRQDESLFITELVTKLTDTFCIYTIVGNVDDEVIL